MEASLGARRRPASADPARIRRRRPTHAAGSAGKGSASTLLDYLAEAEQLVKQRESRAFADDDAQLSDDFDALRWFELPQACLTSSAPAGDRTT